MCDETLIYPLKLIFKASIQEGVFPNQKKANVVSIHIKESKNLLQDYRPISLLPIFDKMYERIIFKELFNNFHQNQLFTKYQSDFFLDDSCIQQLLCIVHEINFSGVFIYISKALDKVWDERILFKLTSYDVDGKMFNLLTNNLHERCRRVVLNGKTFMKLVKSGVPQGSVLGPLFF